MTDRRLDSFRPDAGDRMAPPVRRPWLRIGLPTAILAATAALLLDAGWEAWRPRTAVVAVPVAVRLVETREARPTNWTASGDVVVQAPGWVEADPYEIFVSALTPGTLDRVLVLEGARVTAGQAVATLVDDDARIAVDRARAEVAHRRASIASATAAVTAAETNLRELVAPDRRVAVATAERARLAADLAAFPARIAGVAATRAEVADEFDRKSRLVEGGAAAAGPVARLGLRLEAIDAQLAALRLEQDATAARLDAADAEAHAARRDRDLLVKERLAVATAAAALNAAEADLAVAEATLADAELRLSRCTVVSPVDGVVIERLASPGSTVGPGPDPHSTHVLHLYDPAHLQVRADVPLPTRPGSAWDSPPRSSWICCPTMSSAARSSGSSTERIWRRTPSRRRCGSSIRRRCSSPTCSPACD